MGDGKSENSNPLSFKQFGSLAWEKLNGEQIAAVVKAIAEERIAISELQRIVEVAPKLVDGTIDFFKQVLSKLETAGAKAQDVNVEVYRHSVDDLRSAWEASGSKDFADIADRIERLARLTMEANEQVMKRNKNGLFKVAVLGLLGILGLGFLAFR